MARVKITKPMPKRPITKKTKPKVKPKAKTKMDIRKLIKISPKGPLSAVAKRRKAQREALRKAGM